MEEYFQSIKNEKYSTQYATQHKCVEARIKKRSVVGQIRKSWEKKTETIRKNCHLCGLIKRDPNFKSFIFYPLLFAPREIYNYKLFFSSSFFFFFFFSLLLLLFPLSEVGKLVRLQRHRQLAHCGPTSDSNIRIFNSTKGFDFCIILLVYSDTFFHIIVTLFL